MDDLFVVRSGHSALVVVGQLVDEIRQLGLEAVLLEVRLVGHGWRWHWRCLAANTRLRSQRTVRSLVLDLWI
jgi:hypothetical protein